MASVHKTVSAIRSQVFNTIHNPTNARTGAKYLRRPLRGAAVVKYYPTLPKLATLNSRLPNNPYANWSGVTAGSASSSSSSSAQIESATTSGEEAGEVKAEAAQAEAEAERGSSSSSVARQLKTHEELFGQGFTEVERREGAGWVQDDKERIRMAETQLKHKIGKGPPKKGTYLVGNHDY
jgi:hypothetical protein